MPISVVCSGCAKKLKAPDAAAGKKVRCPACNTVILIPKPEILETPDEDLVEPDEDTAVSEKPRPAKKKDRDAPIEKKRKSRDDDDDDSFDDDEEEEERRPRKKKRKKYFDDDDFRDRPRRRGEPHRGVMILILGILTIFTACLCPLICWVIGAITTNMANNDLPRMDMGRMDRSGESMTRAGKVCAIIGVILGLINAIAGIAINLSKMR